MLVVLGCFVHPVRQGLRMKAQEFGEVSFVPAGAEALALEGVLA
jgi:hypothetical protein